MAGRGDQKGKALMAALHFSPDLIIQCGGIANIINTMSSLKDTLGRIRDQ